MFRFYFINIIPNKKIEIWVNVSVISFFHIINQYYCNLKFKDSKKEDFLDDDFNEIDERLTLGWYVHSGQIKRYLKSLNQKKK